MPHWLIAAVSVLAVLGLLLAVWRWWETTPSAAAPGQEGWVSTQWGPLGPADRDLLVRVRLAGLWEHPTGQEAAERATTPAVREVGRKISAEHQELDDITVAASRDLGVQLPNQPSDQQQGWMREITSSAGARYDATFVNRLRQAHGQVYPVIAQVRANTRNDKVREFAGVAETFVSRHMGYLESTGLVAYDDLPELPDPAPAVVTTAGRYEEVPYRLGALVLLGVLIVGGVLAARLFSGRRNRRAKRSGRHARR